MSAYALPGSFFSSFPSLSDGLTSSTSRNSHSNGNIVERSNATETTSTLSDLNWNSSASKYCTVSSNISRTLHANDEISSSNSTFATSQSNTNTSSSSSTDMSQITGGFLVSIKSATVDHIRLIQSFVTRKPSNGNYSLKETSDHTTFSPAWNNESDEQWGEYCDIENEEEDDDEHFKSSSFLTESQSQPIHSSLSNQIQQQQQQQQQHQEEEKQNDETNRINEIHQEEENVLNPSSSLSSRRENKAQHDAIQFTLTVDFNGRKYTAKRTLMKFMKLRDDLIFEVSKHKSKHDDKEQVVIPELPIGSSTNKLEDLQNFAYSTIGTASSGFSGLQAAVVSFCPLMENWLRSVAALAPFSTSLDHFLWEPLHNINGSAAATATAIDCHKIKKEMKGILRSKPLMKASSRFSRRRNSSRRSMGSLATLDSITEDLNNNGEDGEN